MPAQPVHATASSLWAGTERVQARCDERLIRADLCAQHGTRCRSHSVHDLSMVCCRKMLLSCCACSGRRLGPAMDWPVSARELGVKAALGAEPARYISLSMCQAALRVLNRHADSSLLACSLPLGQGDGAPVPEQHAGDHLRARRLRTQPEGGQQRTQRCKPRVGGYSPDAQARHACQTCTRGHARASPGAPSHAQGADALRHPWAERLQEVRAPACSCTLRRCSCRCCATMAHICGPRCASAPTHCVPLSSHAASWLGLPVCMACAHHDLQLRGA